MNLSLFSSQDLRRLADLVARKEEYLQAAAQIDSELAAITDPTGVPNLPALPPPSSTPPQRGFVDVVSSRVIAREGSVGEQILAVLSKAGPEGKHIREITGAVGRPLGSVNMWLSSETRRGRYPVRRVSPGRYALKGPNGSPAHSEAARSRRGSPMRDAMLAFLQKSPGVGFRVDEIAAQTGLDRRAIQSWLSANRHKFPIVRAAGHYAWKA